ncbi:MAG: hypothetical protein IJY99_01035 [Alphaproteobacteria bacterium]|nr:hypothetical protein [Alphaproteobacteria bacterium]
MELYHGTTVQNLEQITPHYDGHENTAYVFATPNFASALRYVTPCKGNLYFGIENNTAIIVEKFPGAFEQTYKNASGVIYVLPTDSFRLTQLNNRTEYISHQPAIPTRTIPVTDTMKKLRVAESRGFIKIYRYPNIPQNYVLYNEPLFQKIKRFIYKKINQITK